jgi:predicted MPP superfamily phosphohydrolase
LLKSWQQNQSTGSAKQATSAHIQGEGRVVISSSRGDQSSYVRKDGTLSIFTYHLREALRGDANKPNDDIVTVSTLIGHLSRAVPASAQRDWDAQQVPWTDLSGEDFPIVILKTGEKVETRPIRFPSNPALLSAPTSPDQPTPARKNITILHLSDIHLGTTSQAEVYYSQLETDLLNGLERKQLDYLVLCGDVADKATESDYQSAQLLVNRLVHKFKLKHNNIILVPGNHDVDYTLSRQAYSRFIHDPISSANAGERFIQQAVGRVVCDNTYLYQQRFGNFARFYETICKRTYPLPESDQALIKPYQTHKLLFLSLNSADEIDHHYEKRARINMDALAKGLQKLTAKYDDWLKIAVWHHPIRGSEAMNADFMEQIAMRGFQVCMHGHIHETIEDYHKYDDRRGVRVIGAGTFGAPIRQQTPGIPLQYNLITLDPTDCTAQVETRKKDKPEGAWSADARWGDKVRDPKSHYRFGVKWGLCSPDKIKKG